VSIERSEKCGQKGELFVAYRGRRFEESQVLLHERQLVAQLLFLGLEIAASRI
jgi:hypothetical protein